MKTTQMRHRARVDTDTGEIRYQLRQPIDPILKSAADARRAEREGIKRPTEIQHYARVPMVVCQKIKAEYGIDILTAKGEDKARFMKIIEQEYPNLKMTEKKVHRDAGSITRKG